MAKVSNFDGSQIHGKLNKKSKKVHRVRAGREHVYTQEPFDGPPSDAQKLQRSIFGKTNAIVNGIVNDPVQYAEWQERMLEYNRSTSLLKMPHYKKFQTVREYAYAVISEQIRQKPATKRRKAQLPVTLPRGIKRCAQLFSDLTTSDLYEILKARFNVFVCEQHIHYLDEDNIDFVATHFSLRKKGLVIAYARVFPDAQKGVFRIGRMLTLERGKGYGKYLMHMMIEDARAKGAQTLCLHAQTHAVSFYEHLGFHTVGGIFTEAEIPHVKMELQLG